MDKQAGLRIGTGLVFLIVFNVVFFVAGGTDHPNSVWLSYAFVHFAFIMLVATMVLARNQSGPAVLGLSLYALASVYFVLELIVGVVFILLAQDDIVPALVVQVILAGLFLVLLFSNMRANEQTVMAVEQRNVEISYIRTATMRMKDLIGSTDDTATNKVIEKAYDVVHASPTKTDASVVQYEIDLLDAIDKLEEAVAAGEMDEAKRSASLVIDAANTRNQRLRLVQ